MLNAIKSCRMLCHGKSLKIPKKLHNCLRRNILEIALQPRCTLKHYSQHFKKSKPQMHQKPYMRMRFNKLLRFTKKHPTIHRFGRFKVFVIYQHLTLNLCLMCLRQECKAHSCFHAVQGRMKRIRQQLDANLFKTVRFTFIIN